jgi:hypothetical protein
MMKVFFNDRDYESRSSDESAPQATAVASIADDNDEIGSDHILSRLINHLRNKFLSMKLEGSISISRLVGISTSAVACQINADDQLVHSSYVDVFDDRSLNMMRIFDGLISNLVERSKAWEGASYNSCKRLNLLFSF